MPGGSRAVGTGLGGSGLDVGVTTICENEPTEPGDLIAIDYYAEWSTFNTVIMGAYGQMPGISVTNGGIDLETRWSYSQTVLSTGGTVYAGRLWYRSDGSDVSASVTIGLWDDFPPIGFGGVSVTRYRMSGAGVPTFYGSPSLTMFFPTDTYTAPIPGSVLVQPPVITGSQPWTLDIGGFLDLSSSGIRFGYGLLWPHTTESLLSRPNGITLVSGWSESADPALNTIVGTEVQGFIGSVTEPAIFVKSLLDDEAAGSDLVIAGIYVLDAFLVTPSDWEPPGGGIYHGHPIGAGYSGIVVAR